MALCATTQEIYSHIQSSLTQQLTDMRGVTDEELYAAGVSPDLVRLSCGLEDAEDLIADLEQALNA